MIEKNETIPFSQSQALSEAGAATGAVVARTLLAVDVGLRSGLALYAANGKLRWLPDLPPELRP